MKKTKEMESDHEIGGGWGCHIRWTNPEEFKDWSGEEDKLFSTYGHLPRILRAKVGETLLGEFTESFIKFEFMSIERCDDPSDMFFAKVKAIAQFPKE